MDLTSIRLFLVPFLFLSILCLSGCELLGGLTDDDEDGVEGVVEEVGADYLVVDTIRYEVDEETEYEGVSGLAEIEVGDRVEVEYEQVGDTRVAVEIEVGDDDED